MSYALAFTPGARHELNKLSAPRPIRLRIAERIDGLADNPRPVGSRKIAPTADTYRIREGTIGSCMWFATNHRR